MSAFWSSLRAAWKRYTCGHKHFQRVHLGQVCMFGQPWTGDKVGAVTFRVCLSCGATRAEAITSSNREVQP